MVWWPTVFPQKCTVLRRPVGISQRETSHTHRPRQATDRFKFLSDGGWLANLVSGERQDRLGSVTAVSSLYSACGWRDLDDTVQSIVEACNNG